MTDSSICRVNFSTNLKLSWRRCLTRVNFTPKQQLYVRFKEWIIGKPMVRDRMFRDMRPLQDGVVELKTADLRLFGWTPYVKALVLTRVGMADDYKWQTVNGVRQPPKKSYEDEKKKVIAYRDATPLDEPKFVTGAAK
jgi:hypothetical protein